MIIFSLTIFCRREELFKQEKISLLNEIRFVEDKLFTELVMQKMNLKILERKDIQRILILDV